MALAKRIFLFLAINFLVVLMVTLVLDLLHVKPFLTAYGLNLRSLAIFCFVWGMGGALVSLSLSRIMAKWLLNVEVIDPQTKDPELRTLIQSVQRLSRLANIPLPQIGVYRSNEVNAFATGPTRSRALVAVSTALLYKMKEKELDGVIGHEISHIANGDMVTMTLLQGVVNAFVMFLARVFAWLLSGIGRGRSSQSSGGSYMSYMLFVYLFEVVFMILGTLVIAAYSRFREFRADRGGAAVAGKESMIAALAALKSFQENRDPRTDKPALAAFKISYTGKRGLLSLFASHPPLDERIARLEKNA
ncbi:MAG: protease HtpX [Verrucomicrobiota bacterium]|nr:protease HtpX [Verrucomicrobiota bacterium]